MNPLLLFAAGLALLIAGAELTVRGGTRLATRLGVSPLVIGATIVAVGTSTPELAIGIQSSLQGRGALAVGNVAGTNIVNLLLILGMTAWMRALPLEPRTIKFDLPMMIAAAVTLLVMAWDSELSRLEGAILVAGAVGYTIAIVRQSMRESRAVRAARKAEGVEPREREERPGGIGRNLLLLVAGIAITVLGSDWLVDGAVVIAERLGVSDAFIGLTVVAIGTSSPELVTTIVSTIRRDRDIAVGNLIGSSSYNILAILGITCLVPSNGVQVGDNLTRIDIPVMTVVTLLCVPVFLSGKRLARMEGALFVVGYAAYLTYVVVTRT